MGTLVTAAAAYDHHAELLSATAWAPYPTGSRMIELCSFARSELGMALG
jgi:hypothetical protein